jgi:hypothetical protein
VAYALDGLDAAVRYLYAEPMEAQIFAEVIQQGEEIRTKRKRAEIEALGVAVANAVAKILS